MCSGIGMGNLDLGNGVFLANIFFFLRPYFSLYLYYMYFPTNLGIFWIQDATTPIRCMK
jgi:hypothetical protein